MSSFRSKRVTGACAVMMLVASVALVAHAAPNKKAARENEDLVQMGASLLDNNDLVAMGANLLEDEPKPVAAVAIADAGVESPQGADASVAADAGVQAPAAHEVDAGHEVAPAPAPTTPVPTAPADTANQTQKTKAIHWQGPSARIASGQNLDPQGPKESPLAAIVPVKAVPVVATTAAIGAMAVWPFVVKTLTGLMKGIVSGFLKSKAKKGKKVDKDLRTINLLGFILRPFELASLLLAALVYGIAVCYTLQGWKMALPFVGTRELLIVTIYFSRSFVRFIYERAYKLTTQYKFWAGGAMLCLGSAYLGNTLGLVGYEVESTKSPEDTERVLRMKAWLIVLALGMAVAFCIANLLDPGKVLQSGRVMTSGMALGEVMPFTPMAGRKLYAWRKDIWFALFAVVVPAFFIMNLVL